MGIFFARFRASQTQNKLEVIEWGIFLKIIQSWFLFSNDGGI